MEDLKAIDIDLRRKTLAYLVADQGLSQKEAAARLDGKFGRYSQATAARDLQEATKQGWYRPPAFGRESCSPEELGAIEVYAHAYEALESQLRRASGDVLQRLRVFPAGLTPKSGAPAGWDEALSLFGRRVSGYVGDLILKATVVGVGWGHTVAEIVEGMHARGARRVASNFIVLPTAGDPLGEDTSNRSSSAIAARLNGIVAGGRRYSLHGVPPVIPEEFHGDEREIVRAFIGHLRSYREIFGDSLAGDGSGLVHAADMLLTSAGSFHSWVMYKNELVTVGGIPTEALLELCVGDIGGVLIPRPGLSRTKQDEFQRISGLWTGIRLEHYEQLAHSQKVQQGSPGVVLCACGSNKTEIVAELVSRIRVVNTLVIDDTLALALS